MSKPPLPSLFPTTLSSFAPDQARSGPRLWIRRLVIWSERGKEIQNIPLRPGLNVIWSPDADGDDRQMGHGGGKTTFCRLIRYCLGEDSFGTDAQRQLIANAMPEAHVGAEVILDGELWAVIRPIGATRGSHYAEKGGSLTKALEGELPNTTLASLRQAIVASIMAQAAPHMPVGSSADDAWEAALAWISRDQECRLLDILEWRAAETQSRSPSRNMSKAERLSVVRLLLNALQPAEIEATRLAQSHQQSAAEIGRRKDRVEWVRQDVANDLAGIFGGDPGDVAAPDLWASKAEAAKIAQQSSIDPQIEKNVTIAKAALEEARSEKIEAEKKLANAEGQLAGLDGVLRELAEKLPKAELQLQDASNPKCDACGQPLNTQAKAFIADRQAERDALADVRERSAKDKQALEGQLDGLKFKLAAADQTIETKQVALTKLEVAAKETADRLASATGYVTLTTRFRSYGTEIAKLERERLKHIEEEAKARLNAQALRQQSQSVVHRLSALFDAVVRFLIPEGAQGEVVLSEKGIVPRVTLHGDLTTAAVDSLKVVAFDLAALLMTLEGKTQLPGFWLHDSPREADLGLLIYHRLFELARWLEGVSETPQFQYIVTTTTAPPTEFQEKPWLALQLSSAPPTSRLFQRNL